MDNTCYRVVAVRDIIIQPYTEAVINAQILNHPGTGEWGVIEPIPGVLVGRC